MFQLFRSEWRQARRTGSELVFVVFWMLAILAWTGLAAAVPLIVLANLK